MYVSETRYPDHIQKFLQELTLGKPKDGHNKSFSVAPPGIALDRDGPIRRPPIDLWYREVDGFSIDSLLGIVKRELQRHGHPATPELSAFVLAMYAALNPNAREDPSLKLNDVLNRISPARLTQIYSLPIPPPPGTSAFSFGSFTLGRTNTERIKQITLQAGSPDFFMKYGSRFRGTLSIERRDQPCVAINHHAEGALAPIEHNEKLIGAFSLINDEYFSALSASYADDFWTAFDEEQQLQVCFGAPYLYVKDLRNVLDTMMLSVYQMGGMRGYGFVAPANPVLNFDFASADRRIPKVNAELKRDFGFTGYKDTNLDQTIRLFAKYMSRGQQHEEAGHHSDSFLNYIIALELLLAGKDITETVSKRAAVVSHRSLGLDPITCADSLKKMYALRSHYVHAGKEIDRANISQPAEICKIVLAALLKVRNADSRSSEARFLEKWLKGLDHLWISYEAEKPIDERDFAALGIL